MPPPCKVGLNWNLNSFTPYGMIELMTGCKVALVILVATKVQIPLGIIKNIKKIVFWSVEVLCSLYFFPIKIELKVT